MEVFKLLEVCEVYQPKTISKKELKDDGKYKVYGANGVIGFYEQFNHEESEILLTCRGATCGAVNVSEPFSWINGNAMVVKPIDNLLTRNYIKYFLQTIDKKSVITGAAQPQITRSSLEKLKIPVPSLQEQEKIVERLDKVFENINIDLSTTKKMIEYNDSLKQSRIDYLFKSISDKSDKFKLSELGELITGNTPNTQEKDNYGNAIPFIKPGDFNQDGGLNYNNQGLSKKGKLKARLVNKNSVLMVCIGATIGKVGITSKEITTNQQINSIVPSNKIDSYFLYYQMLTTKFQKLVLDSSSQATLPIINKKKWGQIIVDVPTKTIQKESAKALDHFIFLNNELNLKFKLKIKLLKELKKSILIKEFSNE